MTKKRKIMTVAVLLAALLVANWALESWNAKQEEQKSKEEEAAKIYLTEAEDITAYAYSDGEEEMSFAKEEGEWTYDGDAQIPMNQDTLQNTADSIGKISAVRQLENPDELEDYGLTEPMYTIRYTDSDGNETAIYIGNGAGENYYATVGDTGNVYTVSRDVLDLLQFDLAGLVQYDTVPSSGSGNLTKVTVTENGEETVYEDEEDLAELAGGFGTVTLTSVIDYHVTDEKLAEYGLDEAHRITAAAEYTDSGSEETEHFTIYIGALDESGEYRYVVVENSKMVCQVSDSIAQNMIAVDPAEEE